MGIIHPFIILANNADIDLATIIEPQILSAWDDESIAATVNLGKLPGAGIAYLFVFDANNERNTAGYPVALSGVPDTTPPAAPGGLLIN